MNRLQAMQVLVAVIDAGSFVGAAQRLQMSKAVASRLVADLEAYLGVRLLHRTTRKLSLTTEGERFVARCRDLLLDLQEAEDDVRHHSAQARGVLRINVPVSYGVSHLAPLWAGFMRAHPQVLLDVTLSDRLVDLVEEGYDMAVRIGNLASSSLVSRRLSMTQMRLCAAPAYLERHPAPEQPADLSGHRVLSYSLLSSGDVWTFTPRLVDSQPVSVKVTPVMRSNNGDTCRAAAVHGQGLVLQPDFLLQDDLQSGRLVEVMRGWDGATLGIYAVYPSRRHLPAKVSFMVEYLQGALKAS